MFSVAHELKASYAFVERATGVGHEHVVERCGRSGPGCLVGDEPAWCVLGDDTAVVENRDAVAEPLCLGKVVRREHDRRVVRLT